MRLVVGGNGCTTYCAPGVVVLPHIENSKSSSRYATVLASALQSSYVNAPSVHDMSIGARGPLTVKMYVPMPSDCMRVASEDAHVPLTGAICNCRPCGVTVTLDGLNKCPPGPHVLVHDFFTHTRPPNMKYGSESPRDAMA